MEGPSEAKMSCTDNKDGSCSVEYIPYETGTYNLNITYGGQPIKGEVGTADGDAKLLLPSSQCLKLWLWRITDALEYIWRDIWKF